MDRASFSGSGTALFHGKVLSSGLHCIVLLGLGHGAASCLGYQGNAWFSPTSASRGGAFVISTTILCHDKLRRATARGRPSFLYFILLSHPHAGIDITCPIAGLSKQSLSSLKPYRVQRLLRVLLSNASKAARSRHSCHRRSDNAVFLSPLGVFQIPQT